MCGIQSRPIALPVGLAQSTSFPVAAWLAGGIGSADGTSHAAFTVSERNAQGHGFPFGIPPWFRNTIRQSIGKSKWFCFALGKPEWFRQSVRISVFAEQVGCKQLFH
jgi:hypothetical protein